MVAAGYIGANIAKAAHANYMVGADEVPTPPPAKVSIVIPAWKESDQFLEASLSSIKVQNIMQAYPELFETIFVGCEGINMNIPNKYADKVLCAPRGKLLARHMGIENSTGDIIVATDSDSYMARNWLNLMLKPFYDPGVVAVAGTTWENMLEPLLAIPKLAYYSNLMSGRNSAFRKEAYYATGGFDLATNPGNMRDMQQEEEYSFRKKLNALGNVVLVDAPVFHMAWEMKGRGIRSRFNSA